ncbi:hypothetical protein C8R45DRAFT_323852 [Mycena sanguinolenta]|nr:hypothetical protein C8R45DRAFT_323852 [Mycena sanguinolenta]
MPLILDADRARAAEIEAQILDLVQEDSISALRAEKHLVEERLRSYIYPVLTKLPNEMVSEIFVQTLPPYPMCPPLFGRTSPTSLTLICRKWRQIALATPELWRAIPINDLSTLDRPTSEVWAQRSGSLPLSINIDMGFSEEIYPEVLDRRARWEHLTLTAYYTPAIFIIDGPMPLLRHLVLRQHDLDGNFELRDAPQLRSAVFTLSGAVTLPWQQLTHLTMNHSSISQCLQILGQTTNLVCCEVAVWCDESEELDDGLESQIGLACLESLVFNVNPEGPGTRFLNLLNVPALRSLTIRERCLARLDPIGCLTSFIAKSHCRLQILDILGRRRLMPSTYRDAFPSIPELVFNRSYSDEDSEDGEDDSESEEDDSDSSEEDSKDSAPSDGQPDSD